MFRLGRHLTQHGLSLLALLALGWSISAYGHYEFKKMYRDPTSSDGRSGINTPREYYIPPIPNYERMDPKEFGDYHKTYYSPYAQLQVIQPVKIGNTRLNTGYYLVKLDIVEPPPAPLQPSSNPPASQAPQGKPPSKSLLEKAQGSLVWRTITFNTGDEPEARKRKHFPSLDPAQSDPARRPQVSLLIKREGEIEVVVPVSTSSLREGKRLKGSVASLVEETGDPVQPSVLYLKYCVQQICYQSAPLAPGLVQ